MIANPSRFNSIFEKYGVVGEGYRGPARRILVTMNDGTKFSVAAGGGSYSTPSGPVVDPPFREVEVGFPDRPVEQLMPYLEAGSEDPTESVYPWVPVEILDELAQATGGYDLSAMESDYRAYAHRALEENPASGPNSFTDTRRLKTKLLR